MVEPLAPLGSSKSSSSNTNLSTSISLSLYDEHGNEIPFQTSDDHPIEFVIPRDPNLSIPPFVLQNTSASDPPPISSYSNSIISTSPVPSIFPFIGKFVRQILLSLIYLSTNSIVHHNWILPFISSMDGHYFVLQVNSFYSKEILHINILFYRFGQR